MINHITYESRKRIRYMLIFIACLCITTIGKTQSSSVDFGLAINGSGSISTADFTIQIQGITRALQNPLIFPRDGSIGFILVQYASGTTQVHVPYTVINNEQDIAGILQTIQGIRQISGSTNPGDGIARVMGELLADGDPSNEQFLCLSTDGLPNSGQSVNMAVSNAMNNGLDRFSVLAIEDPPFAFEADFKNTYSPLVFGGGAVTVVDSFLEYANILGSSCLTVDLELVGLEVTQVVQNWSNDVRLLENKKTLVRAFIQSKNDKSAPAQARLRAYVNGTELSGSPLTAKNSDSFVAPSKAADNTELINRREQAEFALNFEIPDTWASGTVNFEVEGLGATLTCAETAGTANDCMAEVIFEPSPALTLALYDIAWIDRRDTTRSVNRSGSNDLPNIKEKIVASFPLDDLDYSFRSTRMVVDSVPTFDEILDHLLLVREANNSANQQQEPLYYGNAVNVASKGLADSRGVAAGNETIDPLVSSHEVSHLLGLSHVNACNPRGPFDSFPFFSGGKATLGDNTAGPEMIMFGYNSLEKSILSPFHNFELMAYCFPLWTSSTTYDRLFQHIHEDSTSAAPSNVFVSTVFSPSINSSHTDEDFWLFRGSVNLDNNTASFKPALRFMEGDKPELPNTGDYQLQLLDAEDNILDVVDFEPNDRTGLGGSSRADIASFIIPVIYNPTGAKVRIVFGGNVIGELLGSPSTPTVTVTSPNG
ncbi:MAG: vWA domain-containing protein, partial [Cyclobacteriaceae bacterium]